MTIKASLPSHTRHAELVSVSILPFGASVCGARWTLKQVQGDEEGEKFGMRLMPLFAAGLALASCQQAKQEQPLAKSKMRLCDELTPHAAATNCKANLEHQSRAAVEATYQKAIGASTKLDEKYGLYFGSDKPPHFADRLKSSQDLWVKYVDQQCTFERDTSFGGSGGWDIEPECRDRLNLQRIDQLKQALDLANRQTTPD